MQTVTKELVEAALKTVNDPELGINVVDLGLVYEIRVVQVAQVGQVEQEVHITMTLTTVGCPLGSWFEEQVKQAVAEATGLMADQVGVIFTFDPPWTRDMMHEGALAELGLE